MFIFWEVLVEGQLSCVLSRKVNNSCAFKTGLVELNLTRNERTCFTTARFGFDRSCWYLNWNSTHIVLYNIKFFQGSAVQAYPREARCKFRDVSLTEEETTELFRGSISLTKKLFNEWKGDKNYLSVDDFPAFLEAWMEQRGWSDWFSEDISKCKFGFSLLEVYLL